MSPDFVRVFGDNDRTVRSCLACRGAGPEPTDSVDPAERDAVELVANTSGSSEQLAAQTDATTDDEDGISVTVDDFDDADVVAADVIAPEPPTVSADAGRSRFGFFRAVFSKQRP
uniref:DUF7563 family protein n=1 Tax=Halogranum amylolyticum TaxID=660520 RepID=UPI001114D016|nr:hypothetical protein [Halogranum amylolyticum]